jgi:regulator of replication initiation timing
LINSKGSLDKARTEIANLKTQVTSYLTQIDNLKAENAQLAGENTQLTEERGRLSSDLQTKVTENQSLSTEKAKLASEKEDLTGKVNIASVIRTKSITANGQKVRNSGKVVDEISAKSVEQIKVCFTTLSNEVAKAGNERFFVRIVNPLGETLAVESMGSGTLTNRKTGEDVRFTIASDLSFKNEEANDCVTWAPSNPSFVKGKYTIEVYNKGYLAGSGALTLK